MEDQGEGEMNLDLNLGPVSPNSGGSAPGNATSSSFREIVSLDDWVGHTFHRRYREALRQRARQRWRWRDWEHAHMPLASQHTSMDLMVDSVAPPPPPPPRVSISHDVRGTMQNGEGSNAAEVRNDEIPKTCENIVTQSDDETADKTKVDVERGTSSEGSSFFDCNICLDLSKEPVVTSCGHLFCWPCLYKWLHIHSDAKECPVCKGEVTVKNVTPVFGRGNGSRDPEDDDPGVKIPDRPPARRVESLRQAIERTALSIPMEEMIRRLGSRFDLTRDFFQPQEDDGARNLLERSNVLRNRIMSSRGLRREQNLAVPSDDVDLSLEYETMPEIGEYRRLPHLFYRRSQSYRGAPINMPSPGTTATTTTSAERFVETVIRTPPPQGRSQEQPPSMEDRDSFSSITAVIHCESQTMDSAVEIDSTVSHSTSSSRRRNVASRISDVDSGDSRMPRRRRIN